MERIILTNLQIDVFDSKTQTFVKIDGKLCIALCGPVDNKNGTDQYKINCTEMSTLKKFNIINFVILITSTRRQFILFN